MLFTRLLQSLSLSVSLWLSFAVHSRRLSVLVLYLSWNVSHVVDRSPGTAVSNADLKNVAFCEFWFGIWPTESGESGMCLDGVIRRWTQSEKCWCVNAESTCRIVKVIKSQNYFSCFGSVSMSFPHSWIFPCLNWRFATVCILFTMTRQTLRL